MIVAVPLAATLVSAVLPAVPVSLIAVPVSLIVSLGLVPVRAPSATNERPTACAAAVLRTPACGAAGFGLRPRNRLRYARCVPLFRERERGRRKEGNGESGRCSLHATEPTPQELVRGCSMALVNVLG